MGRGGGGVQSLEQLAGTESVPRPEKLTCVGAFKCRTTGHFYAPLEIDAIKVKPPLILQNHWTTDRAVLRTKRGEKTCGNNA